MPGPGAGPRGPPCRPDVAALHGLVGAGLGKLLGTHELFAVEKIHQDTDWDMHRRFLALFIYRAHCRQDLLETVQLPFMHTIGFWDNPCRHFEDDGMVTRAMLEYRRTTKARLQTGAFRCTPHANCT